MRWVVLAGVLLLAAGLSGCTVACTKSPPFSARMVAPGAPSAAGTGDATIEVQVLDGPGGPGLPGAGIVVYWSDDSAAAHASDLRRPEAGPSATVAEPERRFGTPAPSHALHLRTDGRGVAVASLPRDRVAGVVAAADGMTEEWVPHVTTGSLRSPLAIPLYHSHLEFDLDGAWGPGGASTAFVTQGGHLWQPKEVPLPEEARAGYLARLVHVEGRVSWDNQPTAFGDLGIGVGGGPDRPDAYRDAGMDTSWGPHEESLDLGARDLDEYGLMGAKSLWAGPGSDSAYVAPLGLGYRLHLSLDFDRALADREGCLYVAQGKDDGDGFGVSSPGWALAGAVAVLLLGAAWRRRSAVR